MERSFNITILNTDEHSKIIPLNQKFWWWLDLKKIVEYDINGWTYIYSHSIALMMDY